MLAALSSDEDDKKQKGPPQKVEEKKPKIESKPIEIESKPEKNNNVRSSYTPKQTNQKKPTVLPGDDYDDLLNQMDNEDEEEKADPQDSYGC